MMVSGLTQQDYKGRSKELGLNTMAERRQCMSMQMVHKIMRAEDGLDPRTWFERAADSERSTRITADPLNIKSKAGRFDIRRQFITVRMTNEWNITPADVKRKLTATCFTKAYGKIRDGATHPTATKARRIRDSETRARGVLRCSPRAVLPVPWRMIQQVNK
jgi:hypothetical protein